MSDMMREIVQQRLGQIRARQQSPQVETPMVSATPLMADFTGTANTGLGTFNQGLQNLVGVIGQPEKRAALAAQEAQAKEAMLYQRGQDTIANKLALDAQSLSEKIARDDALYKQGKLGLDKIITNNSTNTLKLAQDTHEMQKQQGLAPDNKTQFIENILAGSTSYTDIGKIATAKQSWYQDAIKRGVLEVREGETQPSLTDKATESDKLIFPEMQSLTINKPKGEELDVLAQRAVEASKANNNQYDTLTLDEARSQIIAGFDKREMQATQFSPKQKAVFEGELANVDTRATMEIEDNALLKTYGPPAEGGGYTDAQRAGVRDVLARADNYSKAKADLKQVADPTQKVIQGFMPSLDDKQRQETAQDVNNRLGEVLKRNPQLSKLNPNSDVVRVAMKQLFNESAGELDQPTNLWVLSWFDDGNLNKPDEFKNALEQRILENMDLDELELFNQGVKDNAARTKGKMNVLNMYTSGVANDRN